MKINLTQEQTNAVASLMGQRGTGVEALEKIFIAVEDHLKDIRNIDPKGNMGLQTLASQKALEMIEEIASVVLPGRQVVQKVSEVAIKRSQWE